MVCRILECKINLDVPVFLPSQIGKNGISSNEIRPIVLESWLRFDLVYNRAVTEYLAIRDDEAFGFDFMDNRTITSYFAVRYNVTLAVYYDIGIGCDGGIGLNIARNRSGNCAVCRQNGIGLDETRGF